MSRMPPPTVLADRDLDVVPGSVVVVRDEEWLVTQVAHTHDGTLVAVKGLSELVRDTSAQFYSALDEITIFDPRETRVVADASSRPSTPWSSSRRRSRRSPATCVCVARVAG